MSTVFCRRRQTSSDRRLLIPEIKDVVDIRYDRFYEHISKSVVIDTVNDTEGIYCMKKKLEKFEAVIDIWDFYLFYGIILFELINLFFYKKLDVISCAVCFSIIATGITISGKLPAFVIGMIEVRFGKIIDGIRKFNK